MTVRDILKMGDPRLLRMAEPVHRLDSDELHWLVTDLLDTMRAFEGVGLAAPQMGVNVQVVVFGTDAPNPRYPNAPLVPRTVLVNPVITPLASNVSQTSPVQCEDWEGCLSLPGLRGVVPRFACIRYTGFDPFGDPIDRVAEGFHARVVQHECDHLIGMLYPMRMRDFRQFGFTDILMPAAAIQSDMEAANFARQTA
jgi:peptide deformylase